MQSVSDRNTNTWSNVSDERIEIDVIGVLNVQLTLIDSRNNNSRRGGIISLLTRLSRQIQPVSSVR